MSSITSRSPITRSNDRRPQAALAGILPLAGILLLALGLRLYRADAQSLWYDEGTSVSLAGRSLWQIAQGAANDIHPPLYYWLLALWVRVFGNGVIALRALSAVLGTVVVGGIWILGRRLWNAQVGWVAALVAAISPYLIWYSQEVRMYVLAAALAVGLVAATLAWWSVGGRRWLAMSAVLTLCLLYTHYLAGAGAVAAANAIAAVAAVDLRRTTGRWPGDRARAWIAGQAVAGAAFLPWLAFAWHTISGWPAISPPITLAFLMNAAMATLALGSPVPPDVRAAWPVLAAVAGLGLAWSIGAMRQEGSGPSHGRSHGPSHDPLSGPSLDPIPYTRAVAAFLMAMAPVVLIGLVSIKRPAWNPKLLVAAAPGFELLLGAGIVAAGAIVAAGWRRVSHRPHHRANQADAAVSTSPANRTATVVGLTRLASAIALAAILWPRTQALRAMYFDPAYQRDDYRAIVHEIATHAGPHDAVVLNAPTQVEIFDYYDRAAHTTYPLPIGRPVDNPATLARLDELGRKQAAVWAVLWATDESDPAGLVERWLNERRFKAYDRWYGNVRLALWGAWRIPDRVPHTIEGPLADFGDELQLAEVQQYGMNAAPGTVLPLTLYWRTLKRPAKDYTVFVQLLDAAGHRVAGRDMAPVGGTARTSKWPPKGQPIADPVGLYVPDELAAGEYRLVVGLYDAMREGTPRLPVRRLDGVAGEAGKASAGDSDAFEVGEVQITASPHDTQ